MKTKIFFLIAVIISTFFVISCSKKDDAHEKPDDHGTGYYWVSNYSASWTDLFLGIDGSSALLKKDQLNQQFSTIVASKLFEKEFVDYTIITNDFGLPRLISIDDVDLVFCYSSDSKMKIAIVDSTGCNLVIRNVISNIDISSLKSGLKSAKIDESKDNLDFIKNVIDFVLDQKAEILDGIEIGKTSKIGLGKALGGISDIFKIIKYLRETEDYSTVEKINYIEEMTKNPIKELIDYADNKFDENYNSDSSKKAEKLLAFDIKTENFSEVTNKSVLCDAQAYLVDLLGTNQTSFSYIIGIRYCDENSDPTKTGIGKSELLYYNHSNTGTTNAYSFRLTGLLPQKKYKYCAFIQCDDFIDYGEVKTFETPYINTDSWEQTSSEKVQDRDNTYYNFRFNQYVKISGKIDYVKEWGFYSSMSGKYLTIGIPILGINSAWNNIQYWSQASISITYTPYLLFKNGEYYLGKPQTVSGSYTSKSADIIMNSQEKYLSNEMVGFNNQ